MAIAINGTGTITGISVGGLNDSIITSSELANGAVTAAKIDSLPAGSILQVAKNQKLDVASATTTSAWTSFTGCTVTITPADSGNRVFGFFSFSHGASVFHNIRNFRVVRGSTVVSDVATGVTVQSTISRLRDLYDANGANYSMLVFEDDLTGYTSGSITYTLQYYATQAGTYYINRSSADTAEWGRGASTFVAVEVQG
jgi:hypothetical protein